MDRESIERVESSRSRPARQQPRKSLVESPLSTPDSSQKEKQRTSAASTAEYFLVRKILDERSEHGDLLYLIDWEDNAETGETYSPTWEPRDNITWDAIREWVLSRQDKAARSELPKPQKLKQDPPASSIDPFPSSQPIRTTKRQRPDRVAELFSSSHPPSKRPRRAGTAETARFQSVSHETIVFGNKSREIKDSYEVDTSQSAGSERIRVEIPVYRGFDREAYAKVSVVSSQPSQNTQSLKSSQASRAPQTPSQHRLSSQRSFIWDEEDEGVPTVQDSQNIPGSSSFKLSGTTGSDTGLATRASTSTTVEASWSTWRSSGASLPLAASGLRQSESSSYLSTAIQDEDFGLSSSQVQVERSLLPSIGSQNFSLSLEESQESPQFRQPSTIDTAESLFRSSGNDIRSQISLIARSSPLPNSAQIFPRLPHGVWSQEESSPRSQVPARERSISNIDQSSSLQFENQVHVASQDKSSFWNAIVQVAQGSEDDTHPVAHSASVRHHTQNPESLVDTPIAHIQGSELNFEGTPRTGQLHSISPAGAQKLQSQDSLFVSQQKTSSSSQNYPQFSISRAPRSPPERRRKFTDTSHIVLPSIEADFPSGWSMNIVSSPSDSRSPEFSPSNAIMADIPEAEMSTAERLRLFRQKAAETVIEKQRIARIASASPHITPSPAPPTVKQTAPVQDITANFAAAATPSPKPSPKREVVPPAHSQLLALGESVHVVPLPMVSLARSVYDQEFVNHRSARRALLNEVEIEDSVVAEIELMIDHMRMICDHQDLILDKDEWTNQQMEPDIVKANWAENISTKCIMLNSLLESLRVTDTHVVLLARDGKLSEILEALFRARNFTYARPDRDYSHKGHGLLQITLLSTNPGERDFGVRSASVVVVFDSTFVESEYVEALRRPPGRIGRIAPRMHLVISHSIEHLELCLPKTFNPLDRKALLVNALHHVRDEMGILEGDFSQPDDAAKAIAGFLIDGASGDWPVPSVPYIEDIAEILRSSVGPNSSEAQPSGSTTQSYDVPSSDFQPSFKRPLLDEEDSESSKRQRLSPVEGVTTGGVDRSQINGTALEISVDRSQPNMGSARRVIAKVRELDLSQDDQIDTLQKKVTELEKTTSDLRQMNQHLELRVQDYERSIDQIQPKYQEALNQRGEAQHDITGSIARETSMRQKLDARIADLAKVKEEKPLADAALLDARASLASSSVPEVAEIQKLRDELNASKAENAKLQKKLFINVGDMEYMRNNYQKASSAAAEMNSELNSLKAQNEILARKSSEATIEIHRIQASNTNKEYIDIIAAMEREKTMLEIQVKRKDDEIKINNTRRATRQTSVPKSPRGTMSPSGRPVGRVYGGVNSRGNSPAPGAGAVEGQSRGPWIFGEPLYPLQGASRFGNHLRGND